MSEEVKIDAKRVQAITNMGQAYDDVDRSSPKCWCKLNSANLSFHKLKHTGFF